MTRYLSLPEILEIHRRVLTQSGSAGGVRDFGAIESALTQPQMTFGGEDLYPTIEAKASAIYFSLVMNHPFVDGNTPNATITTRHDGSPTIWKSRNDTEIVCSKRPHPRR